MQCDRCPWGEISNVAIKRSEIEVPGKYKCQLREFKKNFLLMIYHISNKQLLHTSSYLLLFLVSSLWSQNEMIIEGLHENATKSD